jgi:type I restriction enzyme R subunit
MIGRGTRLCPNLFGPGRHKEFFYIFDWCRNFEFFNEHPDVTEGGSPASLAQRLFAARVELVGEVDKKGDIISVPDYAQVKTVRDGVAGDLRNEILGMSLDNFLVRPHRRYVEKFSADNAWAKIDADAQHDLIDHVAGLPSAVVDYDLAAKQFDLVVFRAELAQLRADPAFEGFKTKIIEIASLLEELSNVPMVAAEMELILEIQTDDFWQDVTLPMLETVRRRLRALVKLIEPKSRTLVYSDFEDREGSLTEVAVPGIAIGTDMDAFRRKARMFLKPYENHIAVLRLKQNEPLTRTDLTELARIFLEAGVDENALAALQKEDGGLPRFVRTLVGLDRQAAKQAFADFLLNRKLAADQLEFLDLLIDHLTARGVMDPKLLYETPFTDFNTNGVEGMFDHADVVRLVQILRDIEPKYAA